jgi:hypothetical protein
MELIPVQPLILKLVSTEVAGRSICASAVLHGSHYERMLKGYSGLMFGAASSTPKSC